jgi:hypothetical protein
MQLFRSRIVLLFICGASLPCLAEWTAGGYLGAAHTQASTLSLRQPSIATDIHFTGVRYAGESFQAPLYYGLRPGNFFSRQWGAEVELIHLKVFAKVDQPALVSGILNGVSIRSRAPISTIVQRFSISHGVNLLLANAVFRQRLWGPVHEHPSRALLNLRFGVGATIPHPESTVQGHAEEHYQVGSPVIQIAGGIELRLWNHLYWTGEYKFTRTREQADVFSGTATTLLRSHHVVTGPVIHF